MYNKAIFGFKDRVTGNKLRAFFKKHTGKDVNFNNIKHYTDGFKLLLFSIPLKTVTTIGITSAHYCPARKFGNLQDFIDWYEKEYLADTDNTHEENQAFENFKNHYSELNLNLEGRLDPYPKFVKPEVLNLFPKRGEPTATITLINGLLCTVPFEHIHECVLILNTNLFFSSGSEKWNDLFNYLEIKEAKEGNITRYTPTDSYVRYSPKYDSDVKYIFNHYNWRLNKEDPFEYPHNWFDVIKLLIPRSGGPVGCDGKYMAAYMLAAPRKYLHYFDLDKSNEDIADDIFYDNL